MTLRSRATPAAYGQPSRLEQDLKTLLTLPRRTAREKPAPATWSRGQIQRIEQKTKELSAYFRTTPEPHRLAPSPMEELDEASRVAGLLGRGYLQQRYEALRCALTRPCVARHEEPGELISTANLRGASRQAVMAKAAGVKSKRAMGERIARAFRDARPLDSHNAFSVVVITRIAPRLLDSDNLESACKALRDGIAAGLGIDDRSPLVRYVVSQQQGEPRQHLIRAELFIEPTQGEAP